MKKLILIPTKLDAIAAELLAAHGGYTVIQDAKTPFAQQAAAHPDAYALIVRSENVTPEIMDAIPGLKVIIRAGAGFNTIDIAYARKKNIDVMNTPGANANGVAEEVVALILADFRKLVEADASTRRGEWEKTKFMGRELTGKTVGIVGLGNIGRLVAKRLSGFECRILGYDPLVTADAARNFNVEITTLENIFAESDVITLHIPENAETKGIVGTRLLSLAKSGLTIVNCARAGIINEAELRAIKPQKNLRYLNDVYPKDEPGPKTIADVADLMVPHIGASTVEANETAARRSATQLIDFDEKGIAAYIVNRDIPEGLDRNYCTLAYTLGALARGLIGRNQALSKIETTFYGTLGQYDKWLLLSTLSGIWDDIDRSSDVGKTLAHLKEMGVDYSDRIVDPEKKFSNSMTLDLLSLDGRRNHRISVRGTVAENVCMVSRVNQFDHLYWVPSGHALFFQYKDRPGVIAAISRRLADADINIEDMRNPFDKASGESLAILNVNTAVDPALIASLGQEINATMSQAIEF